jgi:DNA polymerase III epsilon subunit-like protein
MPIPEIPRFLFLDTETTGVNADDAVCEIGWIEVDENFNFIAEVQSLIDPQRPIASAASAVHGLVLEDLRDSPTIEEYFSVDDETCYGRLITDPVVLCGHNIAFDHRFVKPYITNVVQEVCSLRWARRLYPQADNHKLQTLIFELGLPRATAAHRVLSDVTTSLHLAKHICDRTGMTLTQLAEASAEPMLMATMSFGKHKGKPFREMPAPYMRWMLDTLALDIDLKFTVEQQLNDRKYA